MATILSSKTTGGGGASITGDTSGILQLASADGTTAVTIDASQNVGIGTTSPSGKLHTLASGANFINVQSTTNLAGLQLQSATGVGTYIISSSNGVESSRITTDPTGVIAFSNTASTLERMRIDASGNVGIGTNNPSAKLSIVTGLSGTLIDSNNSTNSGFIVQYANNLTSIGNNFNNPLAILTNNTERMRIDSSGNVLVTSPAGLGYGTGSGGTVTQATSKSTAVTLNKPTGRITMSNVALAAGATVTFLFNNSIIAITDNAIITLVDGSFGTLNTYLITTHGLGVGYLWISVKNISAGSLSEALQINYAIIKGATA